MASTSQPPSVTFVSKDVLCRRADWVDVGKFILFNYALHALTTVPEPGDKPIMAVYNGLLAFFVPFFHIARAIVIIIRAVFRRRRQQDNRDNPEIASRESVDDELETALRVNALCMVVEYEGDNPKPGVLHEDIQLFARLHLSFQIVFGAKGLYDARGHQIERYGYAAYSFTVVPYLLMSLLNLIALLCEPQYPALYLVNVSHNPEPDSGEPTEPKDTSDTSPAAVVHGAIGIALLATPVRASTPSSSRTPASCAATLAGNVVGAISALMLYVLAFGPPFLIIYAISGFKNGESTTSQRVWIMLWIISGQVSVLLSAPVLVFLDKFTKHMPWAVTKILGLLVFVTMSSASIGGLVTVIKMILDYGVCHHI
ncbi:hypothetical protein K440DRAFT_665110 [Wilcoxina mikolae CBS 423.85]|nr:hypothetical protein K440DRAFT_665110 [Wilcoxina mikolae CBS 423.85]